MLAQIGTFLPEVAVGADDLFFQTGNVGRQKPFQSEQSSFLFGKSGPFVEQGVVKQFGSLGINRQAKAPVGQFLGESAFHGRVSKYYSARLSRNFFLKTDS